MIKWNLNELMARHRIKGKNLATYLNVRDATITSLRQSVSMPRIDGEKLDLILRGLNALADSKTLVNGGVELTDLIQWTKD